MTGRNILSSITGIYDDIVATRIAVGNRRDPRLGPEAESFNDEVTGKLLDIEKELKKRIAREVAPHPFYNYWLESVTGVGPILGAQIISCIQGQLHTPECIVKRAAYYAKKTKVQRGVKRARRYTCECPEVDIERFPTISSLRKYAGLAPVDGKIPRPRAGERVTWSPLLKKVLWKVGDSFVKKRKSYYRGIYDEYKKYYVERDTGKISLKQIDNRARLKAKQRFIDDLWVKWRTMKGLPVTKPYAFAVLGHSEDHYEPPPEAGEETRSRAVSPT